jgi:hypothetical protein
MTDVDTEPLVWAIAFGVLSLPQPDGINSAACIALSAACAWLALIAPLVWLEQRRFVRKSDDWEQLR